MIHLKGRIDAFGTRSTSETGNKESKFLEVQSADSKGEYGRYNLPCVLRDNTFPWKQILPGETVTLQRRAKIDSATLYLSDCIIVKTERGRCPILTADELAKEFDANEKETRKKYSLQNSSRKWLVIRSLKVLLPRLMSDTTLYWNTIMYGSNSNMPGNATCR